MFVCEFVCTEGSWFCDVVPPLKKIALNHKKTSRYILRRVEPNLISSYWDFTKNVKKKFGGLDFFIFGGVGGGPTPKKIA